METTAIYLEIREFKIWCLCNNRKESDGQAFLDYMKEKRQKENIDQK